MMQMEFLVIFFSFFNKVYIENSLPSRVINYSRIIPFRYISVNFQNILIPPPSRKLKFILLKGN